MSLRYAIFPLLWLTSLSLGTETVDFKVDFLNQPAVIRFNPSNQKNELLLELSITEVPYLMENVPDHETKPVVITGLEVKTTKAMNNADFGATVLARVSTDGASGQLVFVCSNWRRCADIKRKIDASPAFIRQAVEFTPLGLKDGVPTQFRPVRSAESPAPAPSSLQYTDVVFHRHLDNSMSFAQNWKTYTSGFGSPDGNYWMGLERLSAVTKNRNCKWTAEVTLFSGAVLSATYRDFQVRGADENYRLWFGAKESGSLTIEHDMQHHSNRVFSTFDRDNDDWSDGSCSKDQGGSSGWWFGNCYIFNPNGRIISESQLWTECKWRTGLSQTYDGTRNVCFKRSQLSFRCA